MAGAVTGTGWGYDDTGMYGGIGAGQDSIGIRNGERDSQAGRPASEGECQTCKNRKYQDGSDENVSFKSAAHIAPEASRTMVAAHEAEHVSNAYTEAAQKNGRVINASVSLHTAVCPECGRVYVAGGETRTMVKYPNEENPYQRERKSQDGARLKGAKINFEA